MKEYIVLLEFIDGNCDFRRVKAVDKQYAEEKALSQNNACVGSRYYPSAKKATSAKAQ